MIHGVRVKNLRLIPDERGRLMEILRSDDDLFIRFGQIYMTTAYPGVVKGWHYHKKQIDNFAALKGMIKLVLYDQRQDSPTRGEVNEFFIGEHKSQLVQIPALVLHGFKCVGNEEAIVVNCPTELYNYQEPDEFRVDAFSPDVPYNWAIKLK
jgi:dTDP-4-dehydrorhamnose 3,5-epimerase